MREMLEERERNLRFMWVCVAIYVVLSLVGCATVGGFFKGMWGGAKEAAPKAVDELASGAWQAAAITLGSGILGGGLLWWARGKKKAKLAQGG
jgi:ABC-type Fe3+ transport system permease subunit